MSTIFTTTVNAFEARLAADSTVALPRVYQNDNAEGIDLGSGFLGVAIMFRDAKQQSINPPAPKVRVWGSVIIEVCVPLNTGIAASTSIADKLHTLFSGKNFSGVSCYIGVIDSPRQIQYAKGEYWCTPFICNFYVEEHLAI